MRVILDGRPLQSASGGRGIGRYVRELAPRIAAAPEVDRVFLHLDGRRPDPDLLPTAPALESLRLVPPPGPASLVDRIVSPASLPDAHVYHGTLLPPPRLPAGMARVMTLHDLIPLLSPGSVGPRAALVYRLAFSRAAECHRLVAVSSFTAATVVDHLGIPAERIRVTPLGVDPALASRAREGPACPPWPGRYLLHVGGFDREKNLGLLLEVMDRLARRPGRDGLVLVVAGTGGAMAEAFAARVRARGLEGRIVLPGRLEDEALASAYAGAALFLFPSRWEGFGLPPLEAMSCGCPVISSDAASLPEVVGHAGRLLSPEDPAAWVREIEALLDADEERARLSEEGVRRAARFTWEATASATVRAYLRARETA